jgi:hypothetical protein
MTADVIDLSAFRSRRSEQAAAREAAKADAIAKAQPQARACSLAPLEPTGYEEPIEIRPFSPPKPEPEEPEPIKWRTSAAGNPWAQVGDLHIVVFPDRGDDTRWLVRMQRGQGAGRYVKDVFPSAEAAKTVMEYRLGRVPSEKEIVRTLHELIGQSRQAN